MTIPNKNDRESNLSRSGKEKRSGFFPDDDENGISPKVHAVRVWENGAESGWMTARTATSFSLTCFEHVNGVWSRIKEMYFGKGLKWFSFCISPVGQSAASFCY